MIDLSLFDISMIQETHKKRAYRRQHGYGSSADADSCACDRPGCDEAGQYRAPVSPQDLHRYRYFCFKHIQEHNKKWNFCENMTEADILSHIEKDVVGHRPTWPSGLHATGRKDKSYKPQGSKLDFDDPFDLAKTIFGHTKYAHKQKKQKNIPDSVLNKICEASKILEVDFPIDYEVLRKNYKRLIKKYHPDVNKDDVNAEKELRKVVAAYKTIIAFLQQ